MRITPTEKKTSPQCDVTLTAVRFSPDSVSGNDYIGKPIACDLRQVARMEVGTFSGGRTALLLLSPLAAVGFLGIAVLMAWSADPPN
jgi:hypothetical protein